MKSKRRSILFVPGDSEKFIGKAASLSDVDAIILDLEDGVSPDRKQCAKEHLCSAISLLRAADKEVFVRINDLSTLRGVDDLLYIAKMPPEFQPDAILLPKATESAVIAADTVLSASEAELNHSRSMGLMLMIETAYSLSNILSLLNSSARIQGIVFGAEDYANDLAVDKEQARELLLHAKCTVVSCARSCSVDSFDTPCTDFRNPDVYLSEIASSKSLGFSGKTSIHPIMIKPINDAFSPTPEQVLRAKELLDAYEEGLHHQKGAISFQGKMIDRPIAEQAKKILIKAGELSGDSFKE